MEAREDFAVKQAVTALKEGKSGDIVLVVFGALRKIKNNVETWNKNNPDAKVALIEVNRKE